MLTICFMKKPDQDFLKKTKKTHPNKQKTPSKSQWSLLIQLLGLETWRRPQYLSFWESDILWCFTHFFDPRSANRNSFSLILFLDRNNGEQMRFVIHHILNRRDRSVPTLFLPTYFPWLQHRPAILHCCGFPRGTACSPLKELTVWWSSAMYPVVLHLVLI